MEALEHLERLGLERERLRAELAAVNEQVRAAAVAAVRADEQKIKVAAAARVTRAGLDKWLVDAD